MSRPKGRCPDCKLPLAECLCDDDEGEAENMPLVTTVQVSLKDVEPVAAILAEVLTGDLASREMTKAEAEALPVKAAAAITHLQQAARAIAELDIVKLEPDGS
jgi:hypothetical protein